MTKIDKKESLNEIRTLVESFCKQHLNEELNAYALELCDRLGRKRTISITRGRKEIWAAGIVYLIARLNFLFDPSNEFHLTADTICDFFGTKKSTAGQKATLIEKACKIGIGEPGLCSPNISNMFTFYQTPEGLIIPKSMLKKHGVAVESDDWERPKDNRLFTLDVFLFSGPLTEEYVKKNPVVSRTIEIRGDQTLEELHSAVFDAFDREEEHMYEFQFGGKGPYDPDAERYVLPMALGEDFGGPEIAGDVTRTTIGSLNLKVNQAFGYWFDFGDDWWHQIDVVAIGDEAPQGGKYPRVTKRVGESPPQYADWDEE